MKRATDLLSQFTDLICGISTLKDQILFKIIVYYVHYLP